jgi:hypothetical protein
MKSKIAFTRFDPVAGIRDGVASEELDMQLGMWWLAKSMKHGGNGFV